MSKKDDNIKEEEIETTMLAGVYRFPFPEKIIIIGTHDSNFFDKLRALPPHMKIKLMGLDVEDMQKCIDNKRESKVEEALGLIQKNWYWKESGMRVLKGEEEIPEFDYETIKQWRRNMGSMSIEKINRIIEWFTKENSEVYIKNQ